MGDFLASVVEYSSAVMEFHRQGTISQDSWLSTDDSRCKIHPSAQDDCSREFDCVFACKPFNVKN